MSSILCPCLTHVLVSASTQLPVKSVRKKELFNCTVAEKTAVLLTLELWLIKKKND